VKNMKKLSAKIALLVTLGCIGSGSLITNADTVETNEVKTIEKHSGEITFDISKTKPGETLTYNDSANQKNPLTITLKRESTKTKASAVNWTVQAKIPALVNVSFPMTVSSNKVTSVGSLTYGYLIGSVSGVTKTKTSTKGRYDWEYNGMSPGGINLVAYNGFLQGAVTGSGNNIKVTYNI
jgi:hypothetical protein